MESGSLKTTTIDGFYGSCKVNLDKKSLMGGTGSGNLALVIRPLFVVMLLRLRDLESPEKEGEVTGEERSKEKALITPGFGINTKCVFAGGRNPEHPLEDLSSVGERVVVATNGA